MFTNIDDQIQQTNGQVNRMQQLLRALGVVAVTAILFGSLYLGVLIE